MNKEIIIQSINYLQALLSRFNQTLNGTKNNFSLENYNTYGIKTRARYLVKPNSINNVVSLVDFLNKENGKDSDLSEILGFEEEEIKEVIE